MQISLWKRIKNNSVVLFLFVVVIASWSATYQYAFQKFNIDNAIPVFGTIIQGMSAVLGVSIAVMIFRIQSIENRKYMIEESTLSYIYNIIKWTYPRWGPGLEDDIERGAIIARYFQGRHGEESELQQTRLDYALLSHRNLTSLIQRIRTEFKVSTIILGTPILFSLPMLIATDALFREFILVVVAVNVLVSLIGIIILLDVVIKSTKEIL